MSRNERTGTRDLTFSAWHRNLCDEISDFSDCPYIDIDYCGYCRDCKSILVLMELTKSASVEMLLSDVRKKHRRITYNLACGKAFDGHNLSKNRVIIPFYVLAYYASKPFSKENPRPTIEFAAINQITPIKREIGIVNEKQLMNFIRDIHECEFCKFHKQGRYVSDLPEIFKHCIRQL